MYVLKSLDHREPAVTHLTWMVCSMYLVQKREYDVFDFVRKCEMNDVTCSLKADGLECTRGQGFVHGCLSVECSLYEIVCCILDTRESRILDDSDSMGN